MGAKTKCGAEVRCLRVLPVFLPLPLLLLRRRRRLLLLFEVTVSVSMSSTLLAAALLGARSLARRLVHSFN